MTRYVVISVVAGLLAYDLVVFYAIGPVETISRTVHDAARDEPIWAFLAGMLVGHLFWNLR